MFISEKNKPLSWRSKLGVCSRSEQNWRCDKHYQRLKMRQTFLKLEDVRQTISKMEDMRQTISKMGDVK